MSSYTRTTLACGCTLFEGDPPLRTYCEKHPAPRLTLGWPATTFTESPATRKLPPGAFYDGRIAKEEHHAVS